ncbi:MAG: response regulator [Desulfobacteraceae bacterium]|nr:response regulator [Desulfobacteraceae bacterium]
MKDKISLRNSIGGKIIISFTVVSMISILIIAGFSTKMTSFALKKNAYEKLTAVQRNKKMQIETYFSERLGDIEVAAKSKDVIDAINVFDQYDKEMDIGPGEEFDMSSSKSNLSRTYKDIYDDVNSVLAKYTEIYGYYDLFLICHDHGHVMYSRAKEGDLGENLSAGKYRTTHLAELWRKAREGLKPVVVDMKAYEPSRGAPAMFIGCPIIQHGNKLGVLVFQISLEEINRIMLERQGMGKTGETYLVGSDKRLRSDSYLDPIGHSVEASFAGTVKENGVDTRAAREALAGIEGRKIILDYNGNRVLSSYTPIKIRDLTWALIAEIDESEISKPIVSFAKITIIAAFVILIFTTILAILFSRTISKPLTAVTAIAKKISFGDFKQEKLIVASKDEVALLAMAFNNMTDTLNDVVDQAYAISEGDYSAIVTPRSDKDRLGMAIQQMTEILRDMVRDVTLKIRYLNAVPGPVIAIDKEFNVVFANSAVSEISGRSLEQIQGMKCYDLLRTSNCNTPECLGVRAMRDNCVCNDETVIAPSGKNIPVSYTSAPLRTEEGGIAGAIESYTDITRLQLSIEQNEKSIWLAGGIGEINNLARGETDIRKLATAVCRFLAGYLNVQILTFYIIDENLLQLAGSYAFHKRKSLSDTIEIGEGFVGQAALEKQIISVLDIPDDYVRIQSSIGNSKPRNIVVVPFLYNEMIQGVLEIGSFKEISDQKLELLEMMMDPVGMILHTIKEQDKTRVLLEETQQQSEELQVQQEELRSTNESLEEQTQRLKASEEELRQQSEELRVANEELELKQEDLKTQKDKIETAKSEIETKARELALASKYKSQFLANMSHELRTPLNSLLLLSKGLMNNRKGHLDQSEIEDARVIYDGGNTLLSLINDIMDLSKVEAGKLDIRIEEVGFDALTRNLHDLFSPLATDKDLVFRIDVEDNLPGFIQSDGQRLEQILKNFFSNAIKFTENGSITLRIMRPGADVKFTNTAILADTVIAFSVIDTGIGIPDDKKQTIFEAFQQQDGSTTRQYGGTGLGLTISKELARLLGGEIQLVSRVGEGSTFTLYLPDKLDQEHVDQALLNSSLSEQMSEGTIKSGKNGIIPEPAPQAYQAPQFIEDDRKDIREGDKTLLIIDDDRNFAKILKEYGKKHGYKCMVAGNGRAGIYLAGEYEPSGIILDLGLPDLDGYQVLEQLKFNLKTRHIPIQVISARDEDQDKFIVQGAMGYLAKPVREDQLNGVLKEIERLSITDIKNILVIEDDRDSRRAITRHLENSGVQIDSVGTAKDGYTQIHSNKYDCVILDLGLPDMTGFDLLKKIKDDKSTITPPIIIYTGKELTDKEQEELDKYSLAIIIKGAGAPERLLDEVSLFLHHIESGFKDDIKEKVPMLHDEDAILKNRRVLLVDDDMRNTYALSKKLIETGLDVEMAKHGQEALELLEKDRSYELILMDIMMPVMDGYEATGRIRKMSEYKDIPIIALTAKTMPEDRDRALKAGASEYLMKPIDFKKLLSIMRIWLFKRS